MQIHELNNFTGTLGSGAYLAVDDGTDTGKLSTEGLLASTEARIDNLVSSVTVDSEVIDARYGADGVTYPSLGAAIRTQFTNVKDDITQLYTEVPLTQIDSYDLESGYYSSSDGSKQSSSSFKRTKRLYRIDGGFYYYSGTGSQVRACLYDVNLNFIKHIYINSKTGTTKTLVPTNAVYCGLFISSSATVNTHINIIKWDSSRVNLCEYPFADDSYSFIPNNYMGADGVIRSATTLSMVVLYNVTVGEKYYVSNTADNQGLCTDNSGNLITATKQSVAPYGQIITVPSGTKAMHFNIYNADTEGTSSNLNNYIAKVTQNKKILCIGDSLTWLDGRGPYGGAAHINGYQAELRKHGYEVTSAGWSGYPYTEGIHDTYSIYNEVVNNNYSVSGYDYIILFGGLNDMLYSAPLGSRPADYSNRVFDSETFNGAISGIISYIRTNNSKAKIVLCTPPKSEAATRIWTVAKSYNDEIIYNAEFWSCYLSDIFRTINVQPTYDQFDEYFYDVTHPNHEGMLRIGKQMLLAIENC